MSLGILCPGQGAQHPAMLDPLRAEPEAERVLALAGAVLGASPADLLASSGGELFANVIAQPLICAVELAMWAALASRLPTPRVFAGYSVGEGVQVLSPPRPLSLSPATARGPWIWPVLIPVG